MTEEQSSMPFGENHDTKTKSNIMVAIRCRPPLQREIDAGNEFTKVKLDNSSKQVSAWNERAKSFKTSRFDIVLDQDTPNSRVFETSGMMNIVKHVVNGYHATVFAYGQTGSGKTFTMEGYKYQSVQEGKAPTAQFEAGENEGIVPRSIRLLFDMIKQQSNLQKKKFTVYCSYLQVYKEKIYDLLNKSHVKGVISDGPGLKLKWNKNDVFSVENLYTFECKSVDDVMALYHFGIKNKVVASHNMNTQSSRSHSMLSLTVECVHVENPDNTVVSKLQLVDLAGSERQSQTGQTANKESIDINKSLFTLRQVITALTERSNRGGNANSYVPYRDSKLTCLLRQSLGGNSYCLMIACLNPCDKQIEENISTMQYASQASYISNKPVRNDDPKARQIEDLKEQVRKLTQELAKANETIDFLTKLTKDNKGNLKENYEKNTGCPNCMSNANIHDGVVSPNGKPPMTPGKMMSLNPNSAGGMLPEIKQSKDGAMRPDSAGSALTEKRGRARDESAQKRNAARESSRQSRDSSVVEHRQIITQRIVKDQEKVDKFFKEKADQLKNIASYQRQQNPHQPHSAANESKDAITERIVHTVNMMKEVLQGNLSLRETIQRQSEQLDDRNAEMFQLSQENEDLRERLQVMEEYTGKDSMAEVQKLVHEKNILEKRVKNLEQTQQNWNQMGMTGMQQMRQTGFKRQQMRSSQQRPSDSGSKKATLDNINDDDEPVRPQMELREAYDPDPYYDEEPSNDSQFFQKTNNPISSQKFIGQKDFRVTTQSSAINNARKFVNQKRGTGGLISSQSHNKNGRNPRAPLPNAQHAQNMSDRNRIQRTAGGSVNRQLSKAKTGTVKQDYSQRGLSSEVNSQSMILNNTASNRKFKDLNQTVDNLEYVNHYTGGSVPMDHARKYGRKMSNNQHNMDEYDEPTQPLMYADNDQYNDTFGAQNMMSPQTMNISKKNNQNFTVDRKGPLSKTHTQQFSRPPKSPQKYGSSQAMQMMQQRQMEEQQYAMANQKQDHEDEYESEYYDEEDEPPNDQLNNQQIERMEYQQRNQQQK